MSWCFAIVNNKFAEIYFDRKKNGQIEITGHYYPKRNEFKTKKEQKWIAQDTEKFRFVYRNKKYYKKAESLPRVKNQPATKSRQDGGGVYRGAQMQSKKVIEYWFNSAKDVPESLP